MRNLITGQTLNIRFHLLKYFVHSNNNNVQFQKQNLSCTITSHTLLNEEKVKDRMKLFYSFYAVQSQKETNLEEKQKAFVIFSVFQTNDNTNNRNFVQKSKALRNI